MKCLSVRLLAVWVFSLFAVSAQPPLQLNTTVRSFTTVAGSPWVADIWAYTDQSGNEFALVCQGDLGLSLYDITDPDAPVFASSVPATGTDLKDVKTVPGFAYCAQQSGAGVLIVNIIDPYNAFIAGSFSGPGHNIFIDGNYLYHARSGGSPNGMEIWDISSPTSPVFLSLYDPPNFSCHDVYAIGDRAYPSNITNTSTPATYILDTTDKTNPILLSTISNGASPHSSWMYFAPGDRRILITTNETTGGYARNYDVTDDLNPVFLSDYKTDTNISIHNVVTAGRYAFISYYADYLRILDMGNPSKPIEIGIFDPAPSNAGFGVFDGAWGVANITPTRVVLTESFNFPRGFWVIDFNPPAVPSLTLDSTGVGDLSLGVTGLDPSSPLLNAVSLQTALPFGAGPIAGLQGDALFTLIYPSGTQPFNVVSDGTGAYAFSISGGIPLGLTLDVVGIGFVQGGYQTTEVGRLTF